MPMQQRISPRAELASELGIEHGPAVGATFRRHSSELARQELANLFAECGRVGRERDGIELEGVHSRLLAPTVP